MNKNYNGVLVPILVIALLALAAFALPWRNISWGKVLMQQQQSVIVTGEAKKQEQNQIASFNAGVDAVNDKKDEAIKEVNTKLDAILKSLKEFGIESKDIKTQNLSVYQNEEIYTAGGAQKTRKGQWRVNNSVEITLRDITKASALAEILTNSGATNVYGPNFRMDDTNKSEKELFDAAIQDAREKAEAIAKASGRKLGKVLNVAEGGSGNTIYPMYDKAAGMGGGAAPVEPGSSTVYKNVTVTFELE